MTWSSGFLRLAVFQFSHLIVRVSTKVIAVSGIGRIHAISVASGVEQLRLKICRGLRTARPTSCFVRTLHHRMLSCAELCRKMILAAA
jgi:hypothetical protein